MSEEPKYFETALSDFVHEMASGGAIRHMVDAGYSIPQIMETLDYPTSRERVEQTVYHYMTESGILLVQLPVEESAMKQHSLNASSMKELSRLLRKQIQENGAENSYVSCPAAFGQKRNTEEAQTKIACLTRREQEYMQGIGNAVRRNPADALYHRLNDRMLEIAKQLALYSGWEVHFYFLKTKEVVLLKKEV